MNNEIRIDLQSDTGTRPTPEMRQAMAAAPVGDEQRGEDPSVNRLCDMVAELVGKEAAMFLPSGTMCNQIAILMHCRPGDEIIADEVSHIITSESGGAAAWAGAMVRPLAGTNGIFTAAQLEAGVREEGRHVPRSRLVEVEQTVNKGGGTIWPLAAIHAVAEVAGKHGLAMHLDGARLMNAVVATGVTAREYALPFDSVWIDFSKGLGAPIGAVLAGRAGFIAEAWRWKQRLGGAMRQAGIVAAGAIHALEHHVERLAEDHGNARLFAERIAGLPGLALVPETVETNIVFFDVAGTGVTAAEVSRRLIEKGVRIGRSDHTRLRAVTHLDVTRGDVEEAAEALTGVLTR